MAPPTYGATGVPGRDSPPPDAVAGDTYGPSGGGGGGGRGGGGGGLRGAPSSSALSGTSTVATEDGEESIMRRLLIGVVVGVACGVAAWIYYSILELLLEFFWETLPVGLAASFPGIPSSMHWLWIPTAGMFFASLVGISIYFLGFPGDLGYTVACVHELGYVPMGHAPSMVVSSQASILAGGSLGPEAPLVAICASIAGWVSMRLFGVTGRKRLRAHTLSGMACALAAFFGVPLGGSLFALEINHRLGFEYYEHAVVAVASGSTCLVVFRWLAGLAIAPIWNVTPVATSAGAAAASGVAAEVGAELSHLGDSSAQLVVIGLAFGLLGAGVAWVFAAVHGAIGRTVGRVGLSGRDIPLSLLGGAAICVCAVLVPQSAFWGEFEMQTIASLGKTPLTHLWPPGGLTNFTIDTPSHLAILGVVKLLAISFTVHGGFRGGYIFPAMAAGAAFGRAVSLLTPVPPAIAILCTAAGVTVAITRTVFATTIILTALSGEVNAASPVLAASLGAAFATYYMPFIGSQRAREDRFDAQIHYRTFEGAWADALPAPSKTDDASPPPDGRGGGDIESAGGRTGRLGSGGGRQGRVRDASPVSDVTAGGGKEHTPLV